MVVGGWVASASSSSSSSSISINLRCVDQTTYEQGRGTHHLPPGSDPSCHDVCCGCVGVRNLRRILCPTACGAACGGGGGGGGGGAWRPRWMGGSGLLRQGLAGMSGGVSMVAMGDGMNSDSEASSCVVEWNGTTWNGRT